MGNILVLTDFSEASFRAAEWALILAQKGHSNLIIFHSYIGVPIIPFERYWEQYFERETIVRLNKKSRNVLSEFAQCIRQKIKKDGSNKFKPQIKVEFGEGILGNNIEELTSRANVELVVMGATNKTPLGHILTSNNVAHVIERTTKPVLVVPIESNPGRIERVTFAVSFDDGEIRALSNLTHLAERFGFNIEVVHVVTPGEKTDERNKRILVEKLSHGEILHSINYRAVKGKSVVSRLYQQCKRKASNLLVMTHHQYNLLQRLFHKSTTRKALRELKLPLLIFPANGEIPRQ